jgi:hypothetical protein
MTDDKRTLNTEIIHHDTNEQLLKRYTWYCDNFNPLDDDMIEHLEIIKAEILSRMNAGKK